MPHNPVEARGRSPGSPGFAISKFLKKLMFARSLPFDAIIAPSALQTVSIEVRPGPLTCLSSRTDPQSQALRQLGCGGAQALPREQWCRWAAEHAGLSGEVHARIPAWVPPLTRPSVRRRSAAPICPGGGRQQWSWGACNRAAPRDARFPLRAAGERGAEQAPCRLRGGACSLPIARVRVRPWLTGLRRENGHCRRASRPMRAERIARHLPIQAALGTRRIGSSVLKGGPISSVRGLPQRLALPRG